MQRVRLGLTARAIRWATLAASSVLATGCNVAIGGGILAAGVVASILTYDCTEGVGVTLWDRSTAHPVCDATVVAEFGKKNITFSPCYSVFLDEGSWTVTATKPGYRPAVGTVTISHERRCSEPSYHSLELTLLRDDERPTEDRALPSPPPPSPAPPAPPAPPTTSPALSGEPPPATSTIPPEGPAAPQPEAPPAPGAPSAAPPSARFPLAPKSQ